MGVGMEAGEMGMGMGMESMEAGELGMGVGELGELGVGMEAGEMGMEEGGKGKGALCNCKLSVGWGRGRGRKDLPNSIGQMGKGVEEMQKRVGEMGKGMGEGRIMQLRTLSGTLCLEHSLCIVEKAGVVGIAKLIQQQCESFDILAKLHSHVLTERRDARLLYNKVPAEGLTWLNKTAAGILRSKWEVGPVVLQQLKPMIFQKFAKSLKIFM
jgi:hypothetical protein